MTKDEYEEYRKTEQWQSLRGLALRRAGERCQVCNSADDLDVHHRTYARLGSEHVDDLTVLCHRCHSIFHQSANWSQGVKTIMDSVQKAYERLDKRKSDEKSELLTGYADLDALIGGIQSAELILVAARPGIGKTSFALNVVRNVALEEKLPVLFVSLEQARVELAERLLCCQARVDSLRFRKGHLGMDDLDRVFDGGDLLCKSPLFIDDTPSQSLDRISSNVRTFKEKHCIRLVVIDYLQLIELDGRRQPRHEQVAALSRRLKLLARETEVPIIALSQLNRAAEDRNDRCPRLSDLRDSGALEQDADTVILLHRPDYEPGIQDGMVELIVAKQRSGPTGQVSLLFDRKHLRFLNAMPGDFAGTL
jgi:replicative DNA helicase